MNSLYADLEWLPRPPADFSAVLKALPKDASAIAQMRRLSGFGLDINQLHSLAKRFGAVTTHGTEGLQPYRLGLVSNSTTALLKPALVATGLRYGLALEIVDPGFDQVVQGVLDSASVLYENPLDSVLLALDAHALHLTPSPGNAEQAAATIEGAAGCVNNLVAALQQNGVSNVIVQTVPSYPETLFGSLDARLPGTPARLVQDLNQRMVTTMPAHVHLLDVAGLATTVGLSDWHDPGQWHAAKLAFAPALIPLYADHVLRLIAALRGKTRKVLVLDLDNTVWGGIIGDDGLEGIAIGQGGALGEAHLAIQRMALDLRERGIVLAVCSKNEDATARLPFAQHPDMLLKQDHFAAFHANWIDKASNLREIAKTLNVGLDSLVFLDDNPVERAQVRFELPEVGVPEVSDDAASYPRVVAAAGYFEAATFSDEDRKRAEFYTGNAQREALVQQFSNIGEYLKSLDMEITFAPFDEPGRARIAQLISRSNQFNLTTRRYSEADIRQMEDDPALFTLQIRLVDRFGDNGMISVIICRTISDKSWEIDTWLMSCRVLNRGVETMVLEELAREATAAGAPALVGRFVPSAKNAMVKDHYQKLGFACTQQDADGTASWRLELAGRTAGDLAPMRVVRLPRAAG